jgi:hypothetical protein
MFPFDIRAGQLLAYISLLFQPLDVYTVGPHQAGSAKAMKALDCIPTAEK